MGAEVLARLATMALSARAAVGAPICAYRKESSQLASPRPTTRSIRRAALSVDCLSLFQTRSRGSPGHSRVASKGQSHQCAIASARVCTLGFSLVDKVGLPQPQLPGRRRFGQLSGPAGRRALSRAGAVVDEQAHGIASGDFSGSFSEDKVFTAGRFTEEEPSHASALGNGLQFESNDFSELESSHFGDGDSQAAEDVENGEHMGMPSRVHFSDKVVEVSVLDDSPGGRSREEIARELASVGIEVPSYPSDGPKRSSDASRTSDSNAEKLAAIMAKNGLDPSEFAEQYEEALAKQRDGRSQKGGWELLEKYGGIARGGGDWQEERGVRNRASVAWDGAMERGSR